MFDELLQRVKLSPRGDVVAAAVQLPDLVMFDVVALGLVPVSYGEGEGTCGPKTEEFSVGPQSSGAGIPHGSSESPSPLVVSLSRTRNVPRLLPGMSSSRSASLRPTLPKYHLWREEEEGWAGVRMR